MQGSLSMTCKEVFTQLLRRENEALKRLIDNVLKGAMVISFKVSM